ncbi:MAG: hypothetical protein J6U84_01360 [Bacteroidales bacterium]|nr:hypothetical protein [Bacteroidales bacterium]
MIISTVLLAGFWASVGAFFKWALVGIGLIAVLACLIMFAVCILDNDADNDGIAIFTIVGIVGLVPATFWLFIPYWEVCQWVLFPVLLFFTIITNIRRIPIVRIILLIISIAWSLFLFIKYVVIPYSAFFILLAKIIAGIAVAFLIFVIVKAIVDSINKAIYKKHTKVLRKIIDGMPIPDNAVFDSNTNRLAKSAIKKIKYLNKKIKTATDDETKMSYKNELYEQKIYLFYQLSLRAESNNDIEAYSQFENQLENANSSNDLRYDIEEKNILQCKKTANQEFLENWITQIEKDKKKDYERSIKDIKSMDVSAKTWIGDFNYTSTDKVKSQTNAFAYLANSIVKEIYDLADTQNILNTELTKIRLTAYRNIYLAVELLNYQRDNAGGKGLYVEKDSINADVSQIKTIDINFDKISMNFNEVSNKALKGFEKSMSSLRSMGYNPGRTAAAGLAILSTAGAYISQRNQVIKQNKDEQNRIVREIRGIAPKLQQGRAELLRTIEVMKAIVKSNNGFYSVYAPLRDKVFHYNKVMTIEEVNDLVTAISEFNKTNTAKL